MKKLKLFIVFLSAIILSSGFCYSEELAEKLQNLSVTVHAGGAQGSGVIVTRGGINYILTAAHVVQDLRHVVSFHDDATGGSKKFSKFEIVTVVKEIVKEGKSIGQTEIQAEVVAYSSPEFGDDLALLKLRDIITQDSIEFWNENKISPPVGTKLSHVGSFLGQHGSNSYSEGRISQIGRSLFDHSFDQTDLIAFPGSSGGGIFILEDGKYAGTLVRGAGQGYILYVPMRRIKTWAHNHNIDFIFDKNGKSDGKIKLETLEPESETGESGETSVHSAGFENINKLFPYLLFRPVTDLVK